MGYDYKSGKNRIVEILDNRLEVIENIKLPNEGSFTFTNAYYSWVTGIFVDIRNSSELFKIENKELVAKVIKSFTSEVIEILRNYDLIREIGIRGDCVYAIYTTPGSKNILEIAYMSFYVNSLMKMLNRLFNERSIDSIKVGIGISTAEELVVKAGRKDTGINNKVWIGKAVTRASNLSSFGSKKGMSPIIFSNCTYINIIEDFVNLNKEAESWFTKRQDVLNGIFYDTNLIIPEFDEWIKDGMRDY